MLGLRGRWLELPEQLSVAELNALAHMIDGYGLAKEVLGREAFALADDLCQTFKETGTWKGNAIELLAGFFGVVRGWRGLYTGPDDGDESHTQAQSLYEAIRFRLREHPGEVELVPARAPSSAGS